MKLIILILGNIIGRFALAIISIGEWIASVALSFYIISLYPHIFTLILLAFLAIIGFIKFRLETPDLIYYEFFDEDKFLEIIFFTGPTTFFMLAITFLFELPLYFKAKRLHSVWNVDSPVDYYNSSFWGTYAKMIKPISVFLVYSPIIIKLVLAVILGIYIILMFLGVAK